MEHHKTCIFSVYFTDKENVERKFDVIPDDLIDWYNSFFLYFEDAFGITEIVLEKSEKPEFLKVSYTYRNPDPEFDDAKMNARLIIDPDDDGNFPYNGYLIRGQIEDIYDLQQQPKRRKISHERESF